MDIIILEKRRALVAGWLADNREKLFQKTALMINCEHPTTLQTYVRPRYQEERDIVWSNTIQAQQWYARWVIAAGRTG
jgi:hypothetical protein